MKLLGIRFCTVSKEAQALADFLGPKGLGLEPQSMPTEGEGFFGAVFPAGDSWVEMWPQGPDMPEGVMLQLVVDDADAWADNARQNGLEPGQPMDAHGERIYFLKAPGGLNMSFQSKLPG